MGTLPFCSAPPGATQPSLKAFLLVEAGVSGEGDTVLGVWGRVGVDQSVVQSLSRARLFATPWAAARQAPLSFIISRDSLKLMSSDDEMRSGGAQSCLTPFNLMDCSLPGSSVHGNFQARVLEWVAISFSRGSSPPAPTPGSNPGLPHCRQTLHPLSHQGSPRERPGWDSNPGSPVY